MLNILDNDAPLTYTINDLWVAEGNTGATNATFTVTLSAPAPAGQTVQITVGTADATAKAGTDYVALPPTVLTFTAGQQSQTVTVTVNGDVLKEKNETFTLKGTTVVGVKAADSTGTVTIVNDD
jgi:hypothetical protein